MILSLGVVKQQDARMPSCHHFLFVFPLWTVKPTPRFSETRVCVCVFPTDYQSQGLVVGGGVAYVEGRDQLTATRYWF
jgi:hypothetical protein